MLELSREKVRRHIKTHSERSAEDRSAIALLGTFLNPGGRISTSFAANDTWPNHDGTLDGPYSDDIGPSLLQQDEIDEVVLCLNYDGKFGLNNINRFFQNANQSKTAITWYEWTYKTGDRILFNETARFSVLYNNLKGKIVDIQEDADKIIFTVDVETILTEKDCKREEIAFISIQENSTRIQFSVYKYEEGKADEDEELQMKSVIPFQLAYAVSIHKAQGLEYDSVKVIIPSSNSEKITHGIFNTAITRAKKSLKIYWSSETMKAVIGGFNADEAKGKSLEVIKNKLEFASTHSPNEIML